MLQDRRRSTEDNVRPFSGKSLPKIVGATWLAAAIIIGRAMVEAARITVPAVILLLTAAGLLRLRERGRPARRLNGGIPAASQIAGRTPVLLERRP